MCPTPKCLIHPALMLKWIPGSFPMLFCSRLCYCLSIVYDRGTAGTVCHTDPLTPPLSLCLKQQLKLLSHRLLYFFSLRAFFFFITSKSLRALIKIPYFEQHLFLCEQIMSLYIISKGSGVL